MRVYVLHARIHESRANRCEIQTGTLMVPACSRPQTDLTGVSFREMKRSNRTVDYADEEHARTS